ncbi:MAG TPA: CoA transferase, partial [Noviherbaspirillum sp.]
VLEIPDALAHPQALARDMIVETEHPAAGPVKGIGLPIRFSGGKSDGKRPAPMLGEHTRAVLEELGYSNDEVAQLVSDNAVLVGKAPAGAAA